MCFRGVNDKAPIPAESEQEVPAGIGGRRVNLRFQRLRKPKTPMLLSVGILRELGATIDIDDLCITFKGLDNIKVPMKQSERGHLAEDHGLAERRNRGAHQGGHGD